MPEEVDSCVEQLMDEGHDESSAYAICNESVKAKEDDVDDPTAVKAVAHKVVTGEWGDIHPAEKTKSGRQHLLDTYKQRVEADNDEEKAITEDDIVDDGGNETTEKSDSDERMPHTVKFKMKSSQGIMPLFKAENGEMVIWGPASVEVVDKEGDRIRADALKEALPQLLRRQRLSLEHSDQLVGEILENFKTDEEITVEIDGEEFTRTEFPTDVLELDGMEPSLFVTGKVWDDTRQARQVQEDIENGDIDSYSISGESLVATTKYEEGDVVNDIKELDLSAITLCEEGMNQKAKFGVVSKADGDARTDDGDNVESVKAGVSKGTRGSAGIHAAQEITIVKNMSNDDESSDDEQKSEAVSLEDVREEFKSVVNESLPDAELATKEDMVSKDDVEAIVEEKSLGKDDVRSIAAETAEKVYKREYGEGEDTDSDVEEGSEDATTEGDSVDAHPEGDGKPRGEEKGDDYEDEEEYEDEDYEDEEEEKGRDYGDDEDTDGPDPNDDPDATTEGDEVDAHPEGDGKPRGKEDEEVDVDDEAPPAEEGEEVPAPNDEEEYEEDEDEEMKGYDHGDLEEMLPEDLYEAVREYLDEEPGDGMPDEDVVDEEEPFEASDSDDGTLSDEEVEKMIEERFGDEMVLDSPSGPTEEVQKSWEEEDDDLTDDQVGPAAQQVYDI